MNKYLLILTILILQAWIAQADDVEREMFLERGFSWKHYEKAQKLNLDLENYIIFNKNKSNRVKGAVMMGVGGVFCATGLPYFIGAALVNTVEDYEDDYYYDDDDDFNDFAKRVYIITGSVFTATGVGLIIGGAVKRSKIGKVFTKSGTRLSLRPELDALNDKYGMRLSLSF